MGEAALAIPWKGSLFAGCGPRPAEPPVPAPGAREQPNHFASHDHAEPGDHGVGQGCPHLILLPAILFHLEKIGHFELGVARRFARLSCASDELPLETIPAGLASRHRPTPIAPKNSAQSCATHCEPRTPRLVYANFSGASSVQGDAMGWRFRYPVGILPGVRLNFGKRGASVSVGPRGLKFTARSSGTRISAD